MTKSDLKYFVEEIQAHKFYTQVNKRGEKLYLFELAEREDSQNGKIRACVIDVEKAEVSYTDWYRSFNQLEILLESLQIGINDLVEVDILMSVITDGSNMTPNRMRK